MPPTECGQILNRSLSAISDALKTNIAGIGDKIVSCCYTCFKDLFIKWATITYRQYPSDTLEFVSETAFTDGILKFRELAATGLYDKGASLKTVVFTFCKNKLRELLQQESRLQKKQQDSNLPQPEHYQPFANGISYPDILENALQKMDSGDRQIIIWRHLEERSNEEIAAKLGISVPSATNRIYRCMQRLKQITAAQ